MKNQIISIQLPQFEGPLDLLIQLAQKAEVEIESVSLKELMLQIFNAFPISRDTIHESAESMGQAGHLLWMKSRSLLPQTGDSPIALDEDISELKAPLFEHLVEYCLFKDAARYLGGQEEKSNDTFVRKIISQELALPSGIEHVSLSEFATLFEQVLQKAKQQVGTIHEEEWKISDKIHWIKDELKNTSKIPFGLLFNPERSKLELIVFFLAVLEMMKAGDVKVVKEQESIYIYGERN